METKGEFMGKKRSSNAKNTTVIWALDPFLADDSHAQSVAKALKAWTQSGLESVQPISVVCPEQLQWPGEIRPEWQEKLADLANASIKKTVAHAGFHDVREVKTILQPKASRRESARKLIQFAKRQNAELIAVNTHIRTQTESFFIGSFTEALIAQSSLPVLVVNPDAHVSPRFAKILFATDFSPGSLRAFQFLLPFAKRASAQVVLFHRVAMPIDPVVQSGVALAGGSWVTVDEFLSIEEKNREKDAEKWRKLALKKKVDLQTILGHSTETLSGSILSVAKENHCDLIVMTTAASGVSSALFGSVARQVLRQSPVPTLVIRA